MAERTIARRLGNQGKRTSAIGFRWRFCMRGRAARKKSQPVRDSGWDYAKETVQETIYWFLSAARVGRLAE